MRFFSDFSIRKGADEAVLFLHGFTGGPGAFTYLLPHIACDAFSYTFRGHGPDFRHFHEASASDWLEGAGAALSRLKCEYSRVYLAGYSMGGVVALLLSALSDGLFLFAPAIATAPSASTGKGALSDVNPALLRLCDPEDLEILRFFLESECEGERGELAHLQQRLTSSFPEVCAPAFAFFGSEDPVVLPDASLQLCREHGICCTLIPGCTHALLYGSGYERTAAAFASSLEEVLLRRVK